MDPSIFIVPYSFEINIKNEDFFFLRVHNGKIHFICFKNYLKWVIFFPLHSLSIIAVISDA